MLAIHVVLGLGDSSGGEKGRGVKGGGVNWRYGMDDLKIY